MKLESPKNRDAIVRDICAVSSGTIATLIGRSDYDTIELVQGQWVEWACERMAYGREYRNWQDAWREYANTVLGLEVKA